MLVATGRAIETHNHDRTEVRYGDVAHAMLALAFAYRTLILTSTTQLFTDVVMRIKLLRNTPDRLSRLYIINVHASPIL